MPEQAEPYRLTEYSPLLYTPKNNWGSLIDFSTKLYIFAENEQSHEGKNHKYKDRSAELR